MPPAKRTDWIVFDSKFGSIGMKCQRCGERYQPTAGTPISILIAILQQFVRDHKNCKPNSR